MYAFGFVLVLLAPVMMLTVGLRWKLKPPAFKTGTVVYRTAHTEKSPEIWEFTHVYCAKLWTRYGAILGVLSVVFMVVCKATYQKYLLWVLGGQMLVLCVTIFMMEMFTKNLFDEEGRRIENK